MKFIKGKIMEIEAKNIKSLEELQKLIDTAKEYEEILLKGYFNFDFYAPPNNTMSVGKRKPYSLITLKKHGVTINGINAQINIRIKNPESDITVFSISRGTDFCRLYSIKINTDIVSSLKPVKIIGITINGKKTNVKNSNIQMTALGQQNITGIFINGDNDTRFETDCDHSVIDGCEINIKCSGENFKFSHAIYGIYNNFSNTSSINNNLIEVTTDGNGLMHKAIGIFVAGHYCRINSNNVKASGNHPEAEKIQKPYAIGIENKSSFCVITGNSIVGERGGKCIGVLNNGYYMTLTGNRILSTHSLNAHSIILNGENASVVGNTISTTGKNSRLVDINCSFNTITGNLLDNYCDPLKAITSCGIFSDTQYDIQGIVICGNIIRRYYNIGLYLRNVISPMISGNIFSAYEYASDTLEYKLGFDEFISFKFNESSIKSINL